MKKVEIYLGWGWNILQRCLFLFLLSVIIASIVYDVLTKYLYFHAQDNSLVQTMQMLTVSINI